MESAENSTVTLWDNESLVNAWTETRSHHSLFGVPIFFVGYCELLVAVFGTPANVLVLYLTITFLGSNFRRTSSSYHQSNLWFVVSMTTADFFFCLCHAPMMFSQYVFGVRYDADACFFMYIVTHTTTIASSLSLLWLNVDKFFYLSRPLHYHRCVTKIRALGVMIGTWAISFSWAIFFMLGPFSEYRPPCDFRPSHIRFYMIFAVCFFVLPTLISLSISIYIASVVIRVSKENAIRKNSRKDSSSISSSARRANTKAIVFVFTTTLWSSLTYLPYRIAYLIYISGHAAGTWTTTAVFYVLFALMAGNAAGNPFITIITQRRYTTAVERLWRWIKAGCRGEELRRKSSSNVTSTMLTYQSMTSKISIRKDTRNGGQRLIENPEAESTF